MTKRRTDSLATIALPKEGLAQGTVERVAPQDCRVHVDAGDGGGRIDAVTTVPGYSPGPGDRVLIARRDTGRGWIIGVLPGAAVQGLDARHANESSACASGAEPDTLTTNAGFTVCLAQDDGAERLEVRDPRSRLLYQLEPDTGRALIYAPGGDLTLASATGHVDIVAARGVRCLGRESVLIRAGGSAADAESSSVRLTRQEAALSGERIRVDGRDAQLNVTRMRLVSQSIEATVERVRSTVQHIQHVVGRLVERIRTVHRNVEDLSDLKAGRVREQVEGAHEVRAGHASITCADDLKLDGERIHLG